MAYAVKFKNIDIFILKDHLFIYSLIPKMYNNFIDLSVHGSVYRRHNAGIMLGFYIKQVQYSVFGGTVGPTES